MPLFNPMRVPRTQQQRQRRHPLLSFFHSLPTAAVLLLLVLSLPLSLSSSSFPSSSSSFPLSAVAFAAAAPVVTSAQCDTSGESGFSLCGSGSVVTFTGTGLASVSSVLIGRTEYQRGTQMVCVSPAVQGDTSVSCTLTTVSTPADPLFDGSYPVYMTEGTSSGIGEPLGIFNYGNYYEAPQVPTFIPAGSGGVSSASSAVSSQYMTSTLQGTSNEYENGATLQINGNYDPTRRYRVTLYNVQRIPATATELPGGPGTAPNCTIVDPATDVTASWLRCRLSTVRNALGMYSVQVSETTAAEEEEEAERGGVKSVSSAFLPQVDTRGAFTVRPPPPTVTSATGDCAQDSAKCVDGASITLVGSNFNSRTTDGSGNAYQTAYFTVGDSAAAQRNITLTPTSVSADGTRLTATLAVAAGTAPGPYQIYVQLRACQMGMRGAAVPAGQLLIGEYPQAQLAGWRPNPAASDAPVVLSPLLGVSRFSPSWPTSGDTVTISGAFNATRRYEVVFYNTESIMPADDTVNKPNCTSLTLDSAGATLRCVIANAAGSMGMYKFLVRDAESGLFLTGGVPNTRLGALAVNPPPLTISAVSGLCSGGVSNGTGCSAGQTFVFTGTHFNPLRSEYNELYVGDTEDVRAAVALTTSGVSATQLTAALSFPNTAAAALPPGYYPVYARVQVCEMKMLSPAQLIGTLALGVADPGMYLAPPSLRSSSSSSSTSGEEEVTSPMVLAAVADGEQAPVTIYVYGRGLSSTPAGSAIGVRLLDATDYATALAANANTPAAAAARTLLSPIDGAQTVVTVVSDSLLKVSVLSLPAAYFASGAVLPVVTAGDYTFPMNLTTTAAAAGAAGGSLRPLPMTAGPTQYYTAGDCLTRGGTSCAPGATLRFRSTLFDARGVPASVAALPASERFRVAVTVGDATASDETTLCPVTAAEPLASGNTNTIKAGGLEVSCTLAAVPAAAALVKGSVVKFAVRQLLYPGVWASRAVAVPSSYLIMSTNDTQAWTAFEPVCESCAHTFGDAVWWGVFTDSRGPPAGPSKPGYHAAIALAVIFAVASLAIIVALIVMCCATCRSRRRQRKLDEAEAAAAASAAANYTVNDGTSNVGF